MKEDSVFDQEDFLAVLGDIRTGKNIDGIDLSECWYYAADTTLERDQLLDALFCGYKEQQNRLEFRQSVIDRMTGQIRSLQTRLFQEAQKGGKT